MMKAIIDTFDVHLIVGNCLDSVQLLTIKGLKNK